MTANPTTPARDLSPDDIAAIAEATRKIPLPAAGYVLEHIRVDLAARGYGLGISKRPGGSASLHVESERGRFTVLVAPGWHDIQVETAEADHA